MATLGGFDKMNKSNNKLTMRLSYLDSKESSRPSEPYMDYSSTRPRREIITTGELCTPYAKATEWSIKVKVCHVID